MDMEMPDHQEPCGESLAAPPALISALKARKPREIFVPRTVDERVLRAAEPRLQRPNRVRFPWTGLLRWGMAAGAVALLALLAAQIAWWPSARPLASSPESVGTTRPVDILDAFALARRLQAGDKPGNAMDANGDGVVDERDVITLATKAVELPKGGPS
jgi:hypothetical protein